ncbi:hypothetical protein D1872_291060 [compost metagenome]
MCLSGNQDSDAGLDLQCYGGHYAATRKYPDRKLSAVYWKRHDARIRSCSCRRSDVLFGHYDNADRRQSDGHDEVKRCPGSANG